MCFIRCHSSWAIPSDISSIWFWASPSTMAKIHRVEKFWTIHAMEWRKSKQHRILGNILTTGIFQTNFKMTHKYSLQIYREMLLYLKLDMLPLDILGFHSKMIKDSRLFLLLHKNIFSTRLFQSNSRRFFPTGNPVLWKKFDIIRKY